MGGHPLKKIDTHSTAELKKMSANELIREAQKAIEASDHSFGWFQKQQTAIFFGKRKRTHQMEQAMHAAYEAGDYARRYYRILRDENPWIRATKLTNRTGKTYKVRVPTAAPLSRATAPKPIFNPDWVIN